MTDSRWQTYGLLFHHAGPPKLSSILLLAGTLQAIGAEPVLVQQCKAMVHQYLPEVGLGRMPLATHELHCCGGSALGNGACHCSRVHLRPDPTWWAAAAALACMQPTAHCCLLCAHVYPDRAACR